MFEKTLEELGFSPSEIKVYLRLLEKSPNYANKISAQTGLNRTNVYEALERLSSKGVISIVKKNNVKWFEAKKPVFLQAIVEAKEDELKKTKNNLLQEIKEMNRSFPLKTENLEAGIFTGKNGLRMLFEEILETKKPILAIASQHQFKDFFESYFEQWHKKRILKKIWQKTIFPEKFRKSLERKKFLSIRFIEDKYTNPTTTFICGETCIFIQWSKQPIAIKIQNQELAKTHSNYFEMLWQNAKK